MNDFTYMYLFFFGFSTMNLLKAEVIEEQNGPPPPSQDEHSIRVAAKRMSFRQSKKQQRRQVSGLSCSAEFGREKELIAIYCTFPRERKACEKEEEDSRCKFNPREIFTNYSTVHTCSERIVNARQAISYLLTWQVRRASVAPLLLNVTSFC